MRSTTSRLVKVIEDVRKQMETSEVELREATSATVGVFLTILSSLLTQYDHRVSKKERMPNVNRLPLLLKSVQKLQDRFADKKESAAKEDLEALMDAFKTVFVFERGKFALSPVENVSKQIRAFLDSGKLPKLTKYSYEAVELYHEQLAEEAEEAGEELDEARDLSAERLAYVPREARGSEPMRPEGVDLEFYLYGGKKSDGGEYYGAVAFAGKAAKPLWNYIYKDKGQRDAKIASTIQNRKGVMSYKDAQRKERAEYKHDLKVGDILVSTWGYEQTNVNFYQVIDVRDKSVVIREVGSKVSDTDRGAEYVVPVPGSFISPPEMKRAVKGGVSVDSSRGKASKWDGKPVYQTPFGMGH
jgi:hypothetical protein